MPLIDSAVKSGTGYEREKSWGVDRRNDTGPDSNPCPPWASSPNVVGLLLAPQCPQAVGFKWGVCSVLTGSTCVKCNIECIKLPVVCSLSHVRQGQQRRRELQRVCRRVEVYHRLAEHLPHVRPRQLRLHRQDGAQAGPHWLR